MNRGPRRLLHALHFGASVARGKCRIPFRTSSRDSNNKRGQRDNLPLYRHLHLHSFLGPHGILLEVGLAGNACRPAGVVAVHKDLVGDHIDLAVGHTGFVAADKGPGSCCSSLRCPGVQVSQWSSRAVDMAREVRFRCVREVGFEDMPVVRQLGRRISERPF